MSCVFIDDSADDNRFGDGCAIITRVIRKHPGELKIFSGAMFKSWDSALPDEYKSKANSDILNFYRDLNKGHTTHLRCRLMLLGCGGVGTTALANRLVSGRLPSEDAVTHGIDQRTSCTRKMLSCTRKMLWGCEWVTWMGPATLSWALADVWCITRKESAVISEDSPLTVHITDFGGQVRRRGWMCCS